MVGSDSFAADLLLENLCHGMHRNAPFPGQESHPFEAAARVDQVGPSVFDNLSHIHLCRTGRIAPFAHVTLKQFFGAIVGGFECFFQ